MDQECETPKPNSNSFSNILTPSPEFKPLKLKILELKGTDGQLYSTVFNLLEKVIIIEISDINDISNTKYLINLSLEDFHEINYFFLNFLK